MASVGQAYSKARTKLAAKAAKILTDTCRLIIEGQELENVPCQFSGGGGNSEGPPYRIRFAWGSPAEIGATALIDAVTGRPQLTVELVAPVDSSTDLWQEWTAKAGPSHGRHDLGF